MDTLNSWATISFWRRTLPYGVHYCQGIFHVWSRERCVARLWLKCQTSSPRPGFSKIPEIEAEESAAYGETRLYLPGVSVCLKFKHAGFLTGRHIVQWHELQEPLNSPEGASPSKYLIGGSTLTVNRYSILFHILIYTTNHREKVTATLFYQNYHFQVLSLVRQFFSV